MKSIYIFLLSTIAFVATSQVKEVHILSVNDIHASIDMFPQFAEVVDSLRNIYPDMLLISAGDNRTGNPVNDTYPESSKPMVDLMNYVGFDYSTLGNHEFDDGVSGLRYVIDHSNYKWICANVYPPDSCRLNIEPFRIINRNGVRIGILGLVQTNPNTGYPDAHLKYFGPVKFRPVTEVAREYLWMRQECDVFVLLTHIGFKHDIELARLMPEADLIIGGHSHSKVDPCRMENNVMITQAGRWLKYATLITIKVKNGKVSDRKAQLLTIGNCPRRNQEVQKILDNYNDNKVLKRVLTQSTTDFTRKEELGCLMADAMRSEFKADIAVQNNGGVRYDSKPKGDFTVNDVYRLDPFKNQMVEYTLRGKEVEDMLTNICRNDEYGPAFVSGIKYKIHLGKSVRDIKKLEITMPDGSPFDTNRSYRVVMSSFVAVISNFKENDSGKSLNASTAQTIINYLEKQPSINYQGITRVEVTTDSQIDR